MTRNLSTEAKVTPTGLQQEIGMGPALAARIKTVTNHAALEAIVPTSGAPTFYCTGHTTAGDGGEGLWRWVAGNSDTANGGTTLGSNAAGRWKRQGIVDRYYSAWFGLVPSTSVDQRDDIQAILDVSDVGAPTELRGLICVLNKGTYRIDSPLQFGYEQRLCGQTTRARFASTVIRTNGCRAFQFDGAVKGSGGWSYHNNISDITLWPLSGTTTDDLIYFDYAHSNEIRGINITHSGLAGLHVYDAVRHVSGHENRLFDCHINGLDSYKTDSGYPYAVRMEGGEFFISSCDIESWRAAFCVRGGTMTADRNYVERTTYGAVIANNDKTSQEPPDLTQEVVFIGNKMRMVVDTHQFYFPNFDRAIGNTAGSDTVYGGGNLSVIGPQQIEAASADLIRPYSAVTTKVNNINIVGLHDYSVIKNTSATLKCLHNGRVDGNCIPMTIDGTYTQITGARKFGDEVIVTDDSTQTLPDSTSGIGPGITIINNGSGTVTVNPSGSDTIDSGSSDTISAGAWKRYILPAQSTDWVSIS